MSMSRLPGDDQGDCKVTRSEPGGRRFLAGVDASTGDRLTPCPPRRASFGE